jgi:hypothetical protein
MVDRIRQGRNPEWRLAFEDRLGADARTRIRRAVHRGHSVSDPDEAVIAAGLARRDQRTFRLHGFILLPLQVGFAAVWLVWMLDSQRRLPVAFLWLWASIWVTLVTVGPFMLWRRFRMSRRAAQANDRVAHQSNDLPA